MEQDEQEKPSRKRYPGMPGTPTRPIRFEPALWAEFGELAEQLGTDRSAVIRDQVQKWMRRQRRELAKSARTEP
jgi:hypothetical protein